MTIETLLAVVLLAVVLVPVVWHVWSTRDMDVETMRRHRQAKDALDR